MPDVQLKSSMVSVVLMKVQNMIISGVVPFVCEGPLVRASCTLPLSGTRRDLIGLLSWNSVSHIDLATFGELLVSRKLKELEAYCMCNCYSDGGSRSRSAERSRRFGSVCEADVHVRSWSL